MQILVKEKAGVAILISDKVDLKVRSTIGDTGGHIIMLKELIYQEDARFLSLNPPSNTCINICREKWTGIKGEITNLPS